MYHLPYPAKNYLKSLNGVEELYKLVYIKFGTFVIIKMRMKLCH